MGTFTKRTPKRRQAAIDALALGHGYAATAELIGISVRLFEDWRREDPEFGQECHDTRERMVDMVERRLFADALVPGSTLAQIAFLRAHRPQLYHRRQLVQVDGGVDVNHRLNTRIELDEQGQPVEVINNVRTVFRLPANHRDKREVHDAKATPVIDAEVEDPDDEAAA
jgi:hypothetical protein